MDRTWHRSPPRRLEPGPAEVQVWRAQLDVDRAAATRLSETLSEEERARAARLSSPQQRARFVAGRGILRTILGSYLAVTPADIEFRYGPHGRPELDRPSDRSLCFSVSHSAGLALYAVCRSGKIGVDVERVRPVHNAEAILRRFLPGLGTAELRDGTDFFVLWTFIEAIAKATGGGVIGSPDRAALTSVATQVQQADDDELTIGRFHVRGLIPGDGYRGALAVDGPAPRVTLWEWREE